MVGGILGFVLRAVGSHLKVLSKGVTRAISLFKKSLADVWRMDCSGLVIVEAEKTGGSRRRPGG